MRDPRPDPPGGNAALAERLGVQLLGLEVVEAHDLTPSMRRVLLTGDALARFSHEPGQDLMFSLPDGDGGVVRRRYTIRAHDRGRRTVTIDVVLHGDGPGARWAAAARAGDRVEAIGPRGRIRVDPTADWHLFVGDDSFLPAAYAMAAAVARPRAAILILEVDGPEDEHPVESPRVHDLVWVHRDGAPPESGAALLDATRNSGVDRLPGRGHAYLGGEMRVVAGLRQVLAGLGLTREQLSPKPYWRAGVANAAQGELERD